MKSSRALYLCCIIGVAAMAVLSRASEREKAAPSDVVRTYVAAMDAGEQDGIRACFSSTDRAVERLVNAYSDELAARRRLARKMQTDFPGEVEGLSLPLLIVTDGKLKALREALTNAESKVAENRAKVVVKLGDVETASIELRRSDAGWKLDIMSLVGIHGEYKANRLDEVVSQLTTAQVAAERVLKDLVDKKYNSLPKAVVAYEELRQAGAPRRPTGPSTRRIPYPNE